MKKQDTLWQKLPLKVKLAIIGVISGFVLMVIFVIIMIAPLVELGIIDIGIDSSDNLGMGDAITGTNTYWWPIGSTETRTVNGKTFADGTPAPSNITSYFGDRIDPITNEPGNHNGTDISANLGTNVIASKSGTVIYPTSSSSINCKPGNSECGGGYGNYVIIEHNDGLSTLYAHLQEGSITVTAGDKVETGQLIGKVGNTGRSTGAHLHFEVRGNGERLDGLNYVSKDNPRPRVQTKKEIPGSTNKQTVCLTLSNSEYSTNGVIALMININAESTFNPDALGDYRNGVPTSYGLCQWHNQRWENLRNTFPETYTTIGGQLDYLTYELKNNHASLYESLKGSNTTATELATEFCKKFEIPSNKEITCPNRAKSSVNELTKYVTNNCN